MLRTIGTTSSQTGNQSIVNGNLVIATAGKGIDFTANGGDVLTQYDEGTWTPGFQNGTFTLSGFNRGYYTRVGNMVTASALLIWSAKSGTGDVAVTLPFTAALTFARYGGSLGTVSGIDNDGNKQLTLGLDSGNAYATIKIVNDNASPANSQVANMSASGEVHFTITYFV